MGDCMTIYVDENTPNVGFGGSKIEPSQKDIKQVKIKKEVVVNGEQIQDKL